MRIDIARQRRPDCRVREMPSAEKQRDTDRAGRDHACIFRQEKQGESHRAVFGVISTDQFLLALGQVKRRRLASAWMQIRNMQNASGWVKTFHAGIMPCHIHACWLTRSSRFSVPYITTIVSTANPSGTS